MLEEGWDDIGRGRPAIERARLQAAVATGVAFMLRPSELVKGQRSDHFLRCNAIEMIFEASSKRDPSGMRLTVRKSKKSKDPHTREVSSSKSRSCAARAMKRYMDTIRGELTGNQPLFGRAGAMRALTAKDVKEGIQEAAQGGGHRGKIGAFTGKSMRVGGTNTLIDGSVEAYVIQKHGRWKSEKTFKAVYQRMNKASADKIGKAMG